MEIAKSVAFEVENHKIKIKTLKRSGFGSNMGPIWVKKYIFKLDHGFQAITEKVQVQLWQNFTVTNAILQS